MQSTFRPRRRREAASALGLCLLRLARPKKTKTCHLVPVMSLAMALRDAKRWPSYSNPASTTWTLISPTRVSATKRANRDSFVGSRKRTEPAKVDGRKRREHRRNTPRVAAHTAGWHRVAHYKETRQDGNTWPVLRIQAQLRCGAMLSAKVVLSSQCEGLAPQECGFTTFSLNVP